MEKQITVGGIDVMFKATGATPRHYRRLFHRDIFADMQSLTNTIAKSRGKSLDNTSLEVFENIAYCMAKQADPEIPEPDDWLDQFDMFSIYEILPELIELWNLNTLQIEEPKKKAGKQSGK